MSKTQLEKHNIKSIRKVAQGLLIADTSGEEWLLKGNILLHSNTRGKINEFHRQCEVCNFTHAIKYISSHATKLTRKPRLSRIDYLFSLI